MARYFYLDPLMLKRMSPYKPSKAELLIDPLLKAVVFRPFFSMFVDGLGLKGSERVLDFGSGPGVIAGMIARKLERGGGRLTCLDVTEEWQVIAKRRLRKFRNVDFVFGDIRELHFPSDSFDGIVIHYVLHDIDKEARDATVSALMKTLANGGRLFIREPIKGEHSMPAEEIRSLMGANGLVEIGSRIMWSRLTATYRKI